MIRFEVADTGPGIDPGRQHLLFQTFSQIDRSINRNFGGTGLGLALCKRLVEAMNGTIGVISEPGSGSVFWFELTLEATRQPRLGKASKVSADAKFPARILVAEDLHLNQVIVRSMLEAEGYSVTMVANGLEAVEAISSETHDLVLMDIMMPVMDGITAARSIRSLPEPMGGIPIIALTANAMSNEITRCLQAGMNDHVAKPIKRDLMIAAIERLLSPTGAEERIIGPITEWKPTIDDGVLAEVIATLGGEEFLALAALFREQLTDTAAAIEGPANRSDLEHRAHAMASVSGSLGFSRLFAASRAAMYAARAEAIDLEPTAREFLAATRNALHVLDERYPVRA